MNGNDILHKFEELDLTEDQSNEAWNYLSGMQADLDEKSSGEILKKLFDDSCLTFVQKFYIAYIFGRVEDKWLEYLEITSDAE